MIEDLLDILHRNRRGCSVAEVVSGRPPVDSGPTSCMGGGFYAKAGEGWPCNDHGLMIPLIQVMLSEAPVVPGCLRGYSLVNLFLDRTDLPVDGGARNGDGWLMRLYGAEDVLVPLEAPAELWAGEYPRDRRHFAFDRRFPPRVTRLSWRASEADYPGWEDYGSLLPNYDWDFDELHPRYEEIARQEYGTKVGGWPTYIQGSGAGEDGELALQVSSEEKPRVLFGDNGNVYVFRTSEGWEMSWDCY